MWKFCQAHRDVRRAGAPCALLRSRSADAGHAGRRRDPRQFPARRIGDDRVVLLGNRRMADDVYRAPAELSLRLISDRAVNVRAFDADCHAMQRVDRYVRGTGEDADAYQAIADVADFQQWRNEAFVELVEAVRQIRGRAPGVGPGADRRPRSSGPRASARRRRSRGRTRRAPRRLRQRSRTSRRWRRSPMRSARCRRARRTTR